MPPYKKKRKHLQATKKQFQKIQSRLMEISLKIDNYIYKGKPISLQDSALYIEEVSSYKYQYGKDPRIFQVAEKLIRQLKGVIEEQDTTNSWNVQEVIENSHAVSLPSPTYSEREIDVVQEKDPLCGDIEIGGNEFRERDKEDNTITRDFSLIDTMGRPTEDITIDSLANINKRRDNNFDSYVTINLSDEDDIDVSNTIVTKAQINVCNSPIKEIQRSLSQLAIKTVNKVDQKPTTLRTIRKVSQGSKYYNQSFTSLEKPQRSYSYGTQCRQDITVTTGLNEVNNGIVPTEAIPNSQTIRKTQQFEDTIPQNQPKKRRGRKKTEVKNQEPNDSQKEKPKRRRKNTTLKNQQNNNITVNDTKNIRTYCPKKDILVKSVIEIPSNIQSDSMRTVYNNNVENDLSWVENIRYIREIAPEEIDPKLKYYDDSFWDTFDLPEKWNDQDFFY